MHDKDLHKFCSVANLTKPLKIRWRKIWNPYKQKEYCFFFLLNTRIAQVFNTNKNRIILLCTSQKKIHFTFWDFFFLLKRFVLFLNSNNNKSFSVISKNLGFSQILFYVLRNVLSSSPDVLSPSLFLCKFFFVKRIIFFFILFWVKA